MKRFCIAGQTPGLHLQVHKGWQLPCDRCVAYAHLCPATSTEVRCHHGLKPALLAGLVR